jgi:hypothetical protein
LRTHFLSPFWHNTKVTGSRIYRRSGAPSG